MTREPGSGHCISLFGFLTVPSPQPPVPEPAVIANHVSSFYSKNEKPRLRGLGLSKLNSRLLSGLSPPQPWRRRIDLGNDWDKPNVHSLERR